MIATPSALPTFCIVARAPEAAPGVLGAHRRQDDRGQRGDAQPHPGADQQQTRDERGDRAAGRRRRRPPRAAATWPAASTSAPGGEHAPAVALGQRGRAHRGGQVGAARIVNTSPACSALSPRPCCRYSASTRKNDAWPHQNTSWASSPALNVRCREQARGRAAARRRCGPAGAAGATNAPRITGAAASDSHVHSGQPCWRPSTSGSTIAVSPAVTSAVPAGRSRRRAEPATRAPAAASSASASGADRDVDQEAAAPAEPGRIRAARARRRSAARRRRPGPSPCRRPTARGPGRRRCRATPMSDRTLGISSAPASALRRAGRRPGRPGWGRRRTPPS